MARTQNPHERGRNAWTGWANGYKCRREGVARDWNPYIDRGLHAAWFEGWDAAAKDIELEQVGR